MRAHSLRNLKVEDLPWRQHRGQVWTLTFWSSHLVLNLKDGVLHHYRGPAGDCVEYGCCPGEVEQSLAYARAWYAGVREQQELKPNTKGKRTK